MPEIIRRTQEELAAELRARFGDDHWSWAFICPACGDIATARDFREALDSTDRRDDSASTYLGQVCIGRVLGALSPDVDATYSGRGCDWCAFGLFRGPELVTMPDGREVASFAIAPAPGAEKALAEVEKTDA